MFELQHVSKAYSVGAGSRAVIPVLDRLDFIARRGEFLSVVGRSGCGKTTLLRILAGLIEPSAGRVLMAPRSADEGTVGVGLAPQTPALLPWLTVEENILLPATLRGGGRRRHHPRLDHLLDLVGLGDERALYPHQLSRGMAQRVSLCRALLLRPRLLLLDEPFSSLDAIGREELDVALDAVWRDECVTTVLVTHSLEEAVLLSDRVLVLSPRPARIIGVLPVPLSRPRTELTLAAHEYLLLLRELRLLFGQHLEARAFASNE